MSPSRPQRNTRQRQMILEELRKLTSHPTAADLYKIVRKRLPNIGLGTVYRNLGLLSENRVIEKLDTGGSEARFDGNPELHCHARCSVCGRVGDLPDIAPDPLGDKLKQANGWEILGYRIEFTGTCPKCKGKR